MLEALLVVSLMTAPALGNVNPWSLSDVAYRQMVDAELDVMQRSDAWVEAELARCYAPEVNDPRLGFRYWASRHWRLVNKAGEVTLLRPTPLQLAYLERRTAENVILKYRKGGASTIIDALYYWRCRRAAHQHAYVLTHVLDSTDELYERILFAHREMRPWMAPPVRRSNRKVLHFRDNNSYIRLMTAAGRGSGRAADADAIHLSEAAHYPDLGRTLAAIAEARRSDAWMDLESSPNGYERFRDEYKAALRPGSRRTAHFFAWFSDPSNSLDLDPGEHVAPTADERVIVAARRLTPEQLKWRRAKQLEHKELFPQEHPEDDESCFLAGGVPKFDNASLQRLLSVVEERVHPLSREVLRAAGAPFGGGDDGGRWLVWKTPQPGHRYVVGSDVAEGLPGRANSTGCVLDVTPEQPEQVAEWAGHVSPGDLAHTLAAIGGWYNGALLAVERNNHGHATLRALRAEVGYSPIYSHKHYDQRTAGTIKRPGWPTDGKTRPIMFSDLRECLDNGWMIVRSAEFLKECMAMQAGDEELEEDDARSLRRKVLRDRIFGWGIAWQARKLSEPSLVWQGGA